MRGRATRRLKPGVMSCCHDTTAHAVACNKRQSGANGCEKGLSEVCGGVGELVGFG